MTYPPKRIERINPLLPEIVPSVKGWKADQERVEVVRRKRWNAEVPLYKHYLELPIRNVIFIYSTDTQQCFSRTSCCETIKAMQDFEMLKLGRLDIKYNFLVGGDGLVYEGRGWFIAGQAPPKYYTLDKVSLNIAFIGDYRKTTPPFFMWAAAFRLLYFGIEMGYISKYFDFCTYRALLNSGHRDSDGILPRSEWFALEPKSTMAMKSPVSYVVLMYKAGRSRCQYESRCKRILGDLQRRDFKNDKTDIEYNFLVGGDGLVYEGRGWHNTAPAPPNLTSLNFNSFSIAFIGDYSQSHPNKAMIKSAFRIINLAIGRKIVSRNYDLVTFRNRS